MQLPPLLLAADVVAAGACITVLVMETCIDSIYTVFHGLVLVLVLAAAAAVLSSRGCSVYERRWNG